MRWNSGIQNREEELLCKIRLHLHTHRSGSGVLVLGNGAESRLVGTAAPGSPGSEEALICLLWVVYKMDFLKLGPMTKSLAR